MAAAAAVDRPPARVVNHLDESLRCLQARGYSQLQLLASYPSYMTGLLFHKYEEKPEEHKVYLCLPEPSNSYDAQALAILSSRNKRIAFAPRVITEHMASAFPGLYAGTCLAVAYCTGFCTPKSAQCIYNVYQIVGATAPDLSLFQQHVPTAPYSPVPPPPPVLPLSLQQPQPQPQQQQLFAPLKTHCTICRGPSNRFILPCRHYACCVTCASHLLGQICPTCRSTVTGTTTV